MLEKHAFTLHKIVMAGLLVLYSVYVKPCLCSTTAHSMLSFPCWQLRFL